MILGKLNFGRMRAALMNAFDSNKEELKKAEEGSGEHWITVRGRHILLDSAGEVKAGGKGMAGGKDLESIGKTNSGKNISNQSAKKYQDFTKEDHYDAMRAHAEKATIGSGKKADSHSKYSESHRKNLSLEESTAIAKWVKNKEKEKSGPSDKDLAATEFENTYSKKQAKIYAEGGEPKTKEEEGKNGRIIQHYKDLIGKEDVKITIKNSNDGDPIVFVNGQTAFNRNDKGMNDTENKKRALLRAYKASKETNK